MFCLPWVMNSFSEKQSKPLDQKIRGVTLPQVPASWFLQPRRPALKSMRSCRSRTQTIRFATWPFNSIDVQLFAASWTWTKKRICPTKNDEIQRGQNGLKFKDAITKTGEKTVHTSCFSHDQCPLMSLGFCLLSFSPSPSQRLALMWRILFMCRVLKHLAPHPSQLKMPNQKEFGTRQGARVPQRNTVVQTCSTMLNFAYIPVNPGIGVISVINDMTHN